MKESLKKKGGNSTKIILMYTNYLKDRNYPGRIFIRQTQCLKEYVGTQTLKQGVVVSNATIIEHIMQGTFISATLSMVQNKDESMTKDSTF